MASKILESADCITWTLISLHFLMDQINKNKILINKFYHVYLNPYLTVKWACVYCIFYLEFLVPDTSSVAKMKNAF